MIVCFRDGMSCVEHAALDAHRITAGPTSVVQLQLKQARRWRRSLVGWALPGWRVYLKTLIRQLEKELRDRGES